MTYTAPIAQTVADAVHDGLTWLYNTPQPSGAILQHHGARIRIPTANRDLSLIPLIPGDHAVLVLEVSNLERTQPEQRHHTNPLALDEMEELRALLAINNHIVVDQWNGHPGTSGSLALKEPAHPTLQRAVREYLAGCPIHHTVFCGHDNDCPWYRTGNALINWPTTRGSPELQHTATR